MNDAQKVRYLRMKMALMAQNMSHWMLTFKLDGNEQAEQLLEVFKNSLYDYIAHVDDSDACTASCKYLYFCQKQTGHEGNHRDSDGVGWRDDESDGK